MIQDRGGAEPDWAEGGDDRPAGPGSATHASQMCQIDIEIKQKSTITQPSSFTM